MHTLNLSSPEDSVLSVLVKDSPTLDIGFSKFFKDYQMASDNNLTYAEVLERAKRRWSVLTEEQRKPFFSEMRIPTLSLRSVVGDRLMDEPDLVDTAISDTAFHNFIESFTIKLSQKAAKKWETMSERERAEYAAKEDVGNTNSASSCAVDCDNDREPLSTRAINDMFGCEQKMKRKRRCAKPVKKCQKKPKCSRPKPRCSKPKPKCGRPRRRCAKPKPKCAKSKPPCMLNN